jgi:hypothetical protein
MSIQDVVANSIDNKTENVEEHFAGIYKDLYNSIDDREAVDELYATVESLIDTKSIADVERVTPDVVKEAVSRLNCNKTDPVFSFTSDFFKNSPEILFSHLSIIIKSFLLHAHASNVLLLSTLVPIIKDKMGDICSSKNYRSIAISSLILKIIDWVIIILFGECLHLDDLQFSYQSGRSTTMCTWLAIETIDHFLRNDGEVFSCMMDMTKAFDMVQHSLLFRKLLDVHLSSIFIRLIMVIYYLQYANVRWNQLVSDVFPMGNGVKQGAVLSALLYCIYVQETQIKEGWMLDRVYIPWNLDMLMITSFWLPPSRLFKKCFKLVRLMPRSIISSFQPMLTQLRAKLNVWHSFRSQESYRR